MFKFRRRLYFGGVLNSMLSMKNKVMRYKKSIFIVCLVLLAVISVFFIVSRTRKSNVEKEINALYPSYNIFSRFKIFSASEVEYENDENSFDDNSPIARNDLKYLFDWTWDTKPVKVDVLSIMTEEQSIKAKIILPITSDLGSDERTIKLNCNEEQTIVIYSEEDFPDEPDYRPAIELIKDSDYLYGHCQDPTCSEIGKLCIVERY